MSHFAQLDQTLTVVNVIVADQAFIDSGLVGDAASWVQTSYTGSIRKRFAGVGFRYDPERDAFIAPQPYASWILDDEALDWIAPVPMPEDGNHYLWSEDAGEWIAEQPSAD